MLGEVDQNGPSGFWTLLSQIQSLKRVITPGYEVLRTRLMITALSSPNLIR